jgi:hypothetical protein
MLHAGVGAVAGGIGSSPEDITVQGMVQNAKVHPEVYATLMSNVKLDTVRPEYHRVQLDYKLDPKSGMTMHATSTGVQRSSRLLSMRGADGYMILPMGVKGVKTFAVSGETYPVILTKRPFGNNGIFSGVKVRDSIHLNGPMTTIGVVEVIESTIRGQNGNENGDEIGERLQKALGSDQFMLIEQKKSDLKSLSTVMKKMNECLDIIFVVGKGLTWVQSMHLKKQLRLLIQKEAGRMSYLLQQGAANANPSSVLFEPTVGMSNFDNKRACCLIISLDASGLTGAVEKVKGLLQETLSIARR